MANTSPSGTWVETTTAGETVRAFVPNPLPPVPPPQLTADDHDLMEQANRAVGRLDGLASILPDTSLLVYMYVRKEAVLSSQIEGTQSSLSDLLAFEIEEAPGVPLHDVSEVSNYVAAMEYGLQRLRGGFPLSLRLIREIHRILLSKGRGSEKTPGHFRKTQNWVGGSRPGNARYVPTPPDRLMGCLDPFEKFLHDQPQRTPLLLKTMFSHAQFESIHPFLDGNGRLGRLLITFLLCAEGALSEPLLYLSLYFKQNREEYYDSLQRVRMDGDWLGWLRFFLTGLLTTARQVVDASRSTLALFEEHRGQIQTLGRATGSVLRVHEELKRHPILSIQKTAERIGLSGPTVADSLTRLQNLGVVREVTGKKRNRIYTYSPYLALLAEGTEPLD